MSEAIDEMRAYFNQPPVPPAGALLEHRKKVNRWLNEAEAENQQLQELADDMWAYINMPVDKDHDATARMAYDDLAKRMHEFGNEAYE